MSRDPRFTMTTAPSTGRAARSFRPRTGRMSPTKHRAIAEVLPRYLREPQVHADFATWFDRQAPVILDIGFGMGESTLAIAAAHPEINVVAVDVHIAGHAMLAAGLAEQDLSNVRIVAADAHEVLLWMCAPDSLSEIHVWFSDPWQKQSHSWRRLIQPDFVHLAAQRLAPGGVLRLATDWQPYANEMLRAINAEELLVNPSGSWAPRDAIRPVTSYERKGIAAGRTIRDLVATRI